MKNTLKEKEKQNESFDTPFEKKGNKTTRFVLSIISGNFLSRESTFQKLPFIFFLCFVAICYIANGYYADDQIRKLNKLNSEIKELRTQYIVIKDSLVIKSKQTEVAKALDKLQTGIKESVVPPKKILAKQQNNDNPPNIVFGK